MMNILSKCYIIKIDLDLPLYGEDIFDAYKKRMLIACDVAENAHDYTSIVLMDNGIVTNAIDVKRKREEDILKSVRLIKEKFWRIFQQNQKLDTI